MQRADLSPAPNAATQARNTVPPDNKREAPGGFTESWGNSKDVGPSTRPAVLVSAHQNEPRAFTQSARRTEEVAPLSPSLDSPGGRVVSRVGNAHNRTEPSPRDTSKVQQPAQVRLCSGGRSRGVGAGKVPPGEKPAFKKIQLRAGCPTSASTGSLPASGSASNAKVTGRGSRAANIFNMMAGHTGPVTSEDTVNELAKTYTQRRQYMDKAAELASEMNAKARDIAAMDEHNRQLGFKGDVAHLQATIENQLAAAEPRPQRQRFTGAADVDEDRGEGTAFDLMGTAEDEVEMKAKEKQSKVLKLRLMQRRIAELDDEAVEEEQRYALALKRRQELQERGGYESRRSSIAPSAHSAAESPTAASPLNGTQSGDLKQTMSPHSASRPCHAPRQAPRVTATELRQQFDALLDGDGAADAVLPDPPRNFSANALAVTMEILSQCLDRMVQATDSVCVSATFRGTDETVDVFYDVEKSRKSYRHALLCLDVAKAHLAHFDSGEKAMLEGGQFEVNSLREQTLIRKDTLTAQEQKESAVKDECKALHIRLRKLWERSAMWDEAIFGRGPSHSFSASNHLPNANDPEDVGVGDANQDSHAHSVGSSPPELRRRSLLSPGLSAPRSGSRHSTYVRVLDSSRGLGSRGRRLAGESDSFAPTALPTRLTTLGDYLDHPHNSADAPTVGATREKPLSALYASDDVPLSAEDAMELRVARTWGNPYVTKALQYQQVNNLLPIYQRQLEAQRQQAQHGGAGLGGSQQIDFDPMAQRPSQWLLHGAATDSVSPTAPLPGGGGGPFSTFGPLQTAVGGATSLLATSNANPTVTPVTLPSVVTTSTVGNSEARPARRGTLSITTKSDSSHTADLAGPGASSDTAQPSVYSAGALLYPRKTLVQVAPLHPHDAFSRTGLGRSTLGGSAGDARLSHGPTGGASTSVSFTADAFRHDIVPLHVGGSPFVTQRVAEDRLLTLLQAVLRVMPTERSYIAHFHQGMSDDEEMGADGARSTPRDTSKTRSPHSGAAKEHRTVGDGAGKPSARSHDRDGRPSGAKRAPHRLVAYDVALSTQEKVEMAECEAARASTERLVQLLLARTKGVVPRG